MSPIRGSLLLGTAGLLLGTVACGSTSTVNSSASGVIQVVAAENVWGNIAEQIGGSHVHVTSIVTDPNTDPHEYETDPRDAAAVSRASLIIENGAGYDDFLDKLLSAAGGKKNVVNVEKVVRIESANLNPHLWYSPNFVSQAAMAIKDELVREDPAHTTEFEKNLATFTAAYQPYLDTIAAIKAKYNGQAVSYTERVAGYLVDAAGLHLGTPASFSQAVEDGTDPTPQDTAEFNADLIGHKVKVLLYNSQVTDDQTTKIKTIAQSANVPVIGVSETITKEFASFQDWQTAQAKALLAALGG